MTSVFNYVSLIVDALTDKSPGFQKMFFLSGRGWSGTAKMKAEGNTNILGYYSSDMGISDRG